MGGYKQQQQQQHEYKKKYDEHNISKLSKDFSQGKINVQNFMNEMTIGNHQQAEAYKGLLEAQKKGLVSDILLIKNDDDNFEFHGILTKKGIEHEHKK